jgi:predicted glycoside hydrolase/deacetylase ChbG (UPF0249 family)
MFRARLLALTFFVSLAFSFGIGRPLTAKTWAEKLGYPSGKRVVIFHADDIGMCHEANASAMVTLPAGDIQSAAVMVPCPWFDQFATWYKDHPELDVGLHLALTSEWRHYRWGPVAKPSEVPGLIDKEGFLHRSVLGVVMNASAEEVEKEVRAQIERALSRGIRPGHIDTHMGTLYGSAGFTRAYLKAAEDYQIPAMAIELTPEVVAGFRAQGYPMTDEMIEIVKSYSLPKLDAFFSVPSAKSYEEKREKLFALVKSLQPGLSEVIFHPSIETECLKDITGSWKQRSWEARLFSDPTCKEFFQTEGLIFTNWKEIMRRFRERFPNAAKD